MKKNVNETKVVNEEVVNETKENVVKEETMSNDEQVKMVEDELKADIKRAKKADVKKYAVNALTIVGELLLCAAGGYAIGYGMYKGVSDSANRINNGSMVKLENDVIAVESNN